MAVRLTPEPEVVALLKAIKARLDAIGPFEADQRDGHDVYRRGPTPFLNLEVRRDHMNLDLWLPNDELLGDARASGIARAHPFLGDDAIKVRFERAQDLSRVARWIEASYAYAPERANRPQKVKTVEAAIPPASIRPNHSSSPSSPASRSSGAPPAGTPSSPPAPAEAKDTAASDDEAPPERRKPATKKPAAKKPAKAKAAPKKTSARSRAKGAAKKTRAKTPARAAKAKSGKAKPKAKATRKAPKKARR